MRDKKKILMLGLIDPQKNDASKIHFFELAKSFENLSQSVSLLIPNNPVESELIEGMTVFKMPLNYRENFITIFILSILQFLYYIVLSSNNYDFVYIRWRLLPCFLFRFVNLFKNSKTKIITEHNGWIKLEAEIQHSGKIYSSVGYLLQITDAFFADKVIAVTQGIKDKLIQSKIKESKIEVIGNGTNISHFYPLENREELKERYLKIKDKIVLSFIGNISKWQGLDSLMNIFAKSDNPDLILLIIGSGLYLEELKEKARNLSSKGRIIFKENISYSEMNLWMNIIDIAFAPKSYRLNEIGYSPLKIRDYAAAGKPVISTAVNGIKELAKYGWLKTYQDESECENIISALVSDKKQLNLMSKSARRYAEDNFSWNIIAEKILNINEDISDRETKVSTTKISNKKKKIIMILEKDLLYPVLDRRVFKEAKTLQKNGYQVTIITWAMRMSKSGYPSDYEIDGIKVIRIFQSVVSPDKPNIYKLLPFLILFYKTFLMLLRMKPAYIHCHDAFPLLVSYCGTIFTKSKFIYDSHELNPYREEPKVFLKFFEISEKIVLPKIDYIITANDVRKEFMENHIKVKKNYISLNNYPDLNSVDFYENNNSSKKVVKFLYQGGVSTHRGIDNLLSAISELKDENIILEIYGMYRPNKKKYEDLVEKYKIEDKVILNGAISIEILERKMKTVDVGIVSILNTSLNNYYCAPNKLYDYMKAGLVILGPSFPHIKNEIEENKIGFCCDFENIQSIKKSLLEVLKDKDNLSEMKKRAYELYLKKCNWQAQENKLLEMYRGIDR